jgi:hypothetical protein
MRNQGEITRRFVFEKKHVSNRELMRQLLNEEDQLCEELLKTTCRKRTRHNFIH